MKKIAMFIGELSAEYQYRVCAAVAEECKRAGIHLTVFHNGAVYGANIFQAYGERSIIRIPNIKKYDGFLLASDAFGVEGMYEELATLLKEEAEGPVICLRKEDEHFYSVMVDNYVSMSNMMEHFITEHGFERICFMKGRNDLEDARARYQAYLDAMERHHLKVTEHMTFDGDYWKLRGEQAVSWFWDTADEKPQAIVCANDYMAFSVLDALHKRNLKIPEDVCVSGFDDCEEARLCVPPLSSVHVENEQLAKTAIEMFQRIWRGEPQEKICLVPAECCLRESCGCQVAGRDEEVQRQLYQTKEYLQETVRQMLLMDVDSDNINSTEELFNLAAYYILPGNMKERVFICLCDEEEKKTEKAEMEGKYTEYMELRTVMHTRSAIFCKERFRREDILPEKYLEDNEPLYVSPLHDKNECIGYFVVTPGISESMRYYYQIWVQEITNCFKRQKMYAESKLLTDMLSQYDLDELTGIPNRRKLDAALRNAHAQMTLGGKGYFVVSVDMDELKFINDHYGHVVGDEALCALADILKQGAGETGIAARTGGDEFIICYCTDDEEEVLRQIQGIRDAIKEFNKKEDRVFELSASIGYAKCLEGMRPINCVQQADERMYREKRSKKEKAGGKARR